MYPLRAIVFIFFATLPAIVLRGAVQKSGEWTIDSPDVGFGSGVAVFTNGVSVSYGGATLSADDARVNMTTGDVTAQGRVRITRGNQEWSGEKISYNFKTRQITGEGFRSGQPPFFVGGNIVVGDQTAGVYVGSSAYVTTDDYAQPNYRVEARTLVVVPGEYIEAKGATLYYRDIPIFYFPYYRRALGRHPNNFSFVPGYRSRYGGYLLSSYNWYWNERLDGSIHVDARTKRGIGLGPDLNWHLPRFGEGTFKYYYTHDEEPGDDAMGQGIGDDRQRLYLYHQVHIQTNLVARAMLRYQSDPLFIRDFFEGEYRDNVQPASFLEVDKTFRNFDLNLYVQPRVNDFFETVERLPDVKATGFRQQLGSSPFYYESESSLGYHRRRFANDATNRFSAMRADTFHQVVLPRTFFGWLNVTPRVGGRFTHYGEADGPGAVTSDENRGVFNTGVELSTRASRVWDNARSGFFEANGLRHIVEPSLNYSFVPHPSVPPRRLPQFDYELPTTRLLPIEFPDYNAIDAIDSQNVIRFGLGNRLQTKRRDEVQNVVHWQLYSDWRLNPRRDQETFSDLYSEMDLSPFSWLTVSSDTRYDLNEGRVNEANHRLTLTPSPVWSLALGQRYLREFGDAGPESGHNVFFTTFYYRFNEEWAARISQHFEARDGVLEEQQYTLYRDFRSWTGALTFRVREDRDGPTDYTAAVTFSFKAFPRFGLGSDDTKPSLLLGR